MTIVGDSDVVGPSLVSVDVDDAEEEDELPPQAESPNTRHDASRLRESFDRRMFDCFH